MINVLWKLNFLFLRNVDCADLEFMCVKIIMC